MPAITPSPTDRDRYALLGADGEPILYAPSLRRAHTLARVVLGTHRLAHGHSGWLHASRAEGCASVQVLPIARDIRVV